MARNSSRPPTASNHKKSTKAVKKFNASGYAKRHAQKAARAEARSDDVYEFAPEKSRRAKIGLDLDKEEILDAGGPSLGSDGGDDIEDFRMKARLIGENDEDERIASEDDEEIDSDAAFEEEDEDRYAGFFSGRKKKTSTKKKAKKQPSVRFADVDLNEDEDMEEDAQQEDEGEADSDEEEGEESGADDEFFDVLDILDGRAEPPSFSNDEKEDSNVSKPKTTPKATEPSSPNSDDNDSKSEGDDESDEDDQISVSLSDAEEEAVGALDDLQTFISSLDPSSGSKRKAMTGEDDRDAPTQPKKRRIIKERTEAGAESEFRTKSAGLTLTDLLAPLGDSSSNTMPLEKSVKALQPSAGEPSKKRPQTLSAPLPQRAQERLDREAAYEQTKEEVGKWNATMKRIQEAEHLSFPLQAQPQGKVSNLELAAKFKPTTDLEMTVSRLLASANMATEASILQTEENMLKANALSVEEVAERRRELRRMRELMFRAEVKAKRVKKIKSKVYRRLRRKERDAAGEDAEDADEDDEEKRLRIEKDRARERATLKHKNTGKWAKHMKSRNGYGEEDDDEGMRGGRAEIEEMLARGEKLRRRIQGQESGEEDDSDDDEGEDDDMETAFNELRELRDGIEDQGEENAGKKGKSVFEMKFMKDAMARKQSEANKMVDDFVKEIGADLGTVSEDENHDDPSQDDSGVVVSRAGGRMTFQPGANVHQRQVSNSGDAASHASSSTLKSTSPTTPTIPLLPSISKNREPSRSLLSQPRSSSSADRPDINDNPWLVASSGSHKAPRKKNEVTVAKESSAITKSKNKLKKEARKALGEKAKANDDAIVEIQMDTVLSLGNEGAGLDPTDTVSKSQTQKGKQKTSLSAEATDEDSDADSEIEEQEKALLQPRKGKKVQAIEQRELVARAFAGDNVVKAFEDAKRAEIAADAPKEVDTTLPGWGSWGGAGTTKAKLKPHLIKKVAGVDPKSRADYGKGHVIISEKKDKKAAKYLVKDLPYPYTSKAQFERRMEQPLGPEWNTRVGFQKGTLPKVVKKMGTVIDPLEKLF